MNKQYKVIWSKVKNSYVVVSELAKQHSKGGSTRSKVGQKIGVALAVMALSIGATGVVGAADNTAGSGSGVAVGAGTQATDAVNVAQLTALNDKVDANKISYVSINTKRDANKDNDQAGVPDDKSSRDAAVIGSNDITSGLGNWNLVATGFGNTIKDITYDANTDSVTEKKIDNTYVYGNENIAREGVVIGSSNILTGSSSSSNIAIGFSNKNYGGRSVNLGNYTLTNGVDSIAVGFSAKAPKTDAIAVGGYTQAKQVGSIAIGQGAVANTGGLALGYDSLADRSSGSIGYFTTLGSTDQAVIAEKLGKTAEYNQLVDTINGYSDLAAKERQYRTYISERQNNQDLLSAEIVNLYKNPEGSAAYNTSLAKIREYQQKIKENNNGENSLSSIVSTNNPDYVKLKAARTELRNMFASYMSTADAVSVGNTEKGIYRQITGVAAGSADTDAVNVAQLKAAKVEVLAGANISSIDKDTSAGYTQYKVNAKDTITDSAALNGDTITFTRNDGTTYKVSGLASTSALDTNKTRYFSVKSTVAGNRNNDGATGTDALAAGVSAKATNQADTAIGAEASASGGWSIAAGAGSKAQGVVSVAMGYGATAAAKQAVAIGYAAKVTKNDSVAIGRETQANELNTVAIGLQTKANGNQSMALGYGALTESSANNGLAIGVNAYIGPIRSTDPAQGVLGNSTSVVDDDTVVEAGKEQMNSVALGNAAKAFGYQDTALGAGAEAHDTNSLAVGIMAISKGNYATALGKQAYANGNEATALGHWARAYGDNAIAIGSYAITNTLDGTGTVNNGIAIGQKARVASNNSVALGQNSLAYIPDSVKTEAYLTNEAFTAENGVVSVGNAEYTIGDDTVAANRRRITNVAGGADDYDAVNVAQLTSLSDKVDANKISYVSINTKRDANKDNDQAGVADKTFSKDSAVIGSNTISTSLGNWNLVATGFGNTIKDITYDANTDSVTEKRIDNTYVYGNENIAREGVVIGSSNILTGSSSSSNIAIGFSNKNYGGRSVNLGNYTLTNGVDSIAVGFSAKAPKTDAIAVGGYTQAKQIGSIAIGQGAVANTGGLALGYDSLADRSSGSIGYFTTLGSTDPAAIAEKLGKTAEYNQLVDTINGYSDLAAQERQYRTYISERQNNQDLLSAEIVNLYKNPEGSAAYNTSLAKIREYQQKIKENNNGENSLSSIVSTNNPDYVKLKAARTELRNMFAAYMSTADAVSVGNTEKGIYRQITGVAAGSADTDAVNVAQLKDMGSAGLDFKGDSDTVVHRDLGATLNVVGGNTDATSLTDNNIGVVADTTTGTLNVKLAKNLTMGDGSITFINAKDATGNTLVQGQDGKWYSDLTDATYDATNNVYTKADGNTVSAVENPTVSEVKLSNTGLDNGGNKITNVAAGTVDTDIVNLGQLKGSTIGSSKVEYTDAGAGTITLTMQDGKEVKINGLQDKYVTGASLDGNKLTITRNDDQKFEVDNIATTADIVAENSKVNLKFTGDDTTEDGTITKINGATLNILGGTTEFTTANNIGVVKDGDALRVKLAKDINMGNGSVTFANAKDATGNTLVQGQDGKWYSDLTDATYDATNNVYTKADGNTVSAVENPTVSEVKLSNTGLDNGGNKITNVAAGTVDTDIVNLGQLKGSTIGSSKVEYTDAGAGTITLTMQDGKEVKINGLQDKYVTGATFKDNTLTITRNDDTSFKVGDIASKTDMDSAVSNANLKFTGDDKSEDAAITKKNGETLTIYGGVAATDADGNRLLSDVNNVGVVKTDDGLQIKLAKDLAGIDSARIGGTVADGVATGGIYIANQSVTYNGSAKKTENGLYITGLANTAWNPTTDGIVSGRAATEDQLKAAYDGLSTTITANKVVAGDNITVTPLEDGSGTKVSLSDNLAFGDKNGKNIAISGNDAIISAGDGGSNKVVVDGANSTVTAGTGANQVTVDGTKAAITAGEGANQVAVDGTKGQVTIGETGKGLVIGNQDVAVKNADGTDKVDENGNAVKDSGKYITGLDNTTWNPAEKGYVPDRAATEGQLKDIVGQFDVINNAKRGFNSDTGVKVERGKDDVLDIKGGAKGDLSEGNIGVVNNTDATGFDVKLAKDLKDLNSITSNTVTTNELTVSEKANIGNVSISNDNVTIGTGDSQTVLSNESITTGSVTTGNTTVNDSGVTIKVTDSSKSDITLTNDAISMGSNRVQNIAAGVEATDAINKGQFDSAVSAIGNGMNQLGNSINKLDNRVNRVGAGAAALAALHPLEYDPESKWEISAGVGNYKSANALALGAFYCPNSDTMFSVGSSYGGGENMVNAGVTLRIGPGETLKYSSKREMAQKINDLESVVADQKGELTDLKSVVAEQKDRIEELTKLVNALVNK